MSKSRETNFSKSTDSAKIIFRGIEISLHKNPDELSLMLFLLCGVVALDRNSALYFHL